MKKPAEKNTFLQQLKKSVLIADGGMGTIVQQLTSTPVQCVKLLNCTKPKMIRDIHSQFMQVRAVIIETNMFAANRSMLQIYQRANRKKEINR